MDLLCPQCKLVKDVPAGRVNQARKAGLPMYCGRVCSGLARRKENPKSPKNPNWKAMKSAYDSEYREKNHDRLKLEKAARYKLTADREKEREYRKENMSRHVEYCRRPEYKATKKVYDRQHRAKKFYGKFFESAMALFEIETEINRRSTWLERKQENGLINKSTKRKRDYARTTGFTKPNRNRPQGFPVGYPSTDQVRQDAASAG